MRLPLLGQSEEIRFSLDRTDLWDRTVLWEQNKEFTWKNLVKLAKAGNTAKIREIFDAPYYYPSPTKLTAGRILLHFYGIDGEIESVLNLETAKAEMRSGSRKETVRISAWVHAVEQVGIIEVEARETEFSVELKNPGIRRKRNGKRVRLLPGRKTDFPGESEGSEISSCDKKTGGRAAMVLPACKM